jgi:hypothetical protein
MQFDMLGPCRASALRARPAAVLSPLKRLGLPLATTPDFAVRAKGAVSAS